MNTHLRRALARLSIAGALLLMLQCGTDPFAGNGTTLPPGAQQCGEPENSSGCGSASSVAPGGTVDSGPLPSSCSGQVYVELTQAGGFASEYTCCDCFNSESPGIFVLCSGGTFSACDCENPGDGWTRDTSVEAGILPDTGVKDTGVGVDTGAEAGGSNEANGAPCSESSQCASGNCSGSSTSPGWCTQACASSTDCPSAPYVMWCIEDTAGADYCFPDCTSTDCATVYGSEYSCKDFTTVDGTSVEACST
jgi:hypothetical protein